MEFIVSQPVIHAKALHAFTDIQHHKKTDNSLALEGINLTLDTSNPSTILEPSYLAEPGQTNRK